MWDAVALVITGAVIGLVTALVPQWIQWKREREQRAEERWADFQRQSLDTLLTVMRSALIETAELYAEKRADAHTYGVWPRMPLRPGWNRAHYEATIQIAQIAAPLKDAELTNLLEQFEEKVNTTVVGETQEASAEAFAQSQTHLARASARIGELRLAVEKPSPSQSRWKPWKV